jgi:serine/threonine-protein kinase
LASTRREDDPLGLLGQELLGRYFVKATLAYGGMSVVYEGHDVRLRRPVCIKVFHRLDPRDPAYRTTYEHFVQEAFALSQLKHPNTLRIYDFGYLEQEPKSPLHVCELLDGGTVAQHVRKVGPLPPVLALEILEPVIGALSEAHARGVVHRDLKPNNVLFGTAGSSRVVKLVDFGIAKALADAEVLLPHAAQDTSAAAGQRMSLYSPGWAAPEQLHAEAIGPTADVFSLGLLAAYLMSAKTIFSTRSGGDYADERALGDAHVMRKLVEWKIENPVAQVIARACRELPEERYASVDEMGVALRAAVRASEPGLRIPEPSGPTSSPSLPVRTVTTSGSGVGPGLPGQGAASYPDAAGLPPGIFGGPVFVAPAPAPPVLAGQAADPLAEAPVAPRDRAEPRLTPTTQYQRVASTTPVLVLDRLAESGEIVAAGRRLRVVPLGETIDIGGPDGALVRSPARLRLTLLPDAGRGVRLHVKGLNCFVSKLGDRPTAGVAIVEDEDLELCAPDRKRLDVLRCVFGSESAGGARTYPLGAVTLAVAASILPAILLDLGPGRELALLHRVKTR